MYTAERKRDERIERKKERERRTSSGKKNRVKRRGSGRAKKRRVKAPGEVTHRPRPPHSLIHPDYPPPGAGRSVMSIEEVLNLGLFRKFSWLTSKQLKNLSTIFFSHAKSKFYLIFFFFNSVIIYRTYVHICK